MSIYIAPIAQAIAEFLSDKSYSKIIVLTDTNTHKYCYPILKPYLPKHTVIKIKAGEAHKNIITCEQIWEAMTEAELDRHALMIDLGGGVVGDMGGFCASTYKRGIDFIQIPTTLLSQVDASVGGKLGIDFHGFKNHIGVFTQPKAVLIDALFLKTLSVRELRSGFAEVVKHCLIADADKWSEIRLIDFEAQNWIELIAHSVEIKKKIVAIDPTEKGLRKVLNFGHTLGHAVETYFLSKPTNEQLLHGEAIAAGMVMEAFVGYRKKMIDLQTLERIEEFIFSVYGKVDLKATDTATIIELAKHDKKNKDGQLRFSLLENAGHCAFDVVVTNAEIRQAVEYYVG
jgi:3-dehydroquinate synthase